MATRVLAYSDSKVFGGAEAVFCEVLGALRGRSEFEIETAAPKSNFRLIKAVGSAGIESSIEVPAQALTLAAVDLYNPLRHRTVARAVAAAKPDALLVNLPSAEYGALPLRLKRRGERRVGILHVARSPRELDFRLGAVREHLARRALRSLDVACVLSDSATAAFRQKWDHGRADLHRLALPRPRLSRMPRAAARRQLGLAPDACWVGIAGRISIRQKGHDTFVEAAARMLAQSRSARFAVAGEGRDRRKLERMVERAGLTASFEFLGAVRPIDRFLAALDAIVIPSRFEGLPLIALEALAAGVPGIATRVDGLSDCWPPQWLVPPDDADALAVSLALLLEGEDDERARIMAPAKQKMRDMTTTDPAASIAAALRL